MTYSKSLHARCDETMAAEIEAIADRTDLDESEVIRRLIRLGQEDLAECGDQVLLGDAATPT